MSCDDDVIKISPVGRGVRGPIGPAGPPGDDGKSAYEIWLAQGNTGSEADFIGSLHGGQNGLSAYQLWLSLGHVGTEADFIASLAGADGADGADGQDGKSAFEIWLDQGHVGTPQDFIDSVRGAAGQDGQDGESAYAVWLSLGNTGSEAEFISAIKGDRGDIGPAGAPGESNYRSLTFQSPEGGPFEMFPTAYREIVGGVFPSSITWYEDSSKAKKILERQIVRDASQNPTQITQILYNTDGVTPLKTAVDTLSLLGPFELSRTRVTS